MTIFKKGTKDMDAKTTGIVAYLTWIGLLIALLAGDKEGAKFHINQALVIMLFSLLSPIPCIGWAWGIFMLVCWIMGLIAAINEEEKPVPELVKRLTDLKKESTNVKIKKPLARFSFFFSLFF